MRIYIIIKKKIYISSKRNTLDFKNIKQVKMTLVS